MEIKSPILFAAYQEMGVGRADAVQVMKQYYPVNDERLANMEIPIGEEAEAYIKECERGLKLLDAGVIPISTEAKDEKKIVQQENKTNKCVSRIVSPRVSSGSWNDWGIANFVATPIAKKIYIDAEGIEYPERETFEVDVRIEGLRNQMLEIKTSEIGNLAKIIKKRFAFANVNYSEKDADKIIESEFREKTMHVKTRRVLFQAGWQIIANRWRYVSDGRNFGDDVLIATGKRLPRNFMCERLFLGRTFLEILNITKDRNENYVMALFSLLGILYKPLEIAGIAPRFTLFINGKSGAMKSSLAKVLFTQLSSDEHRKTLRRIDADTLVSFERAIVESGRDTTILFDDYAPAKTTQQKNEMRTKLESIIRMVGDGSTKSRSNGKLSDLKGRGVHGVVAVTGELKGTGLSSNLRCIYVEMKKGSVNKTTLSYFQRNQDVYSTFLSHFVDYVEENWAHIVNESTARIDEYRINLSEMINEPRVIDSALALQIAADIVSDFLRTWCGVSEEIVNVELGNMKNAIINIAIQNERMAEVESYSELFINSIAALINLKEIVLGDRKLLADEMVSYDGFCEGEYLYFIPDKVYAKCVRYIQQIGQFLPFDMKEMSAELYHDGFIKSFSNGKNHKTYFCRLKVSDSMKANFWKMKRDLFIKIVNGN